MPATHDRFTLFVRLGYAARGLVYILLGYLALGSAGKASSGPHASLKFLQDVPLGSAVLVVTAAGLAGYAAYKFIAGISDVERLGADVKAIAHRLGYIASAIAHAALAWTALLFAQGEEQAVNGDPSSKAAASLLSFELGALLLGLVGLGFVAAALFQARSAMTASFMRYVRSDAPASVCWIGRIGHGARTVVFLIIGWSLVRSAWLESGSEAKGLGGALTSLKDSDALYSVVAIGLLFFGIFSCIVTRFLVIPNVQSEISKLNPK